MRRTYKLLLSLLLSLPVMVGTATAARADVMQGTGHLEGRSTACVGPFFIDGANGGFIVQGHASPQAGRWTVLQSADSSFTTSVTVLDFTNTDLNQFVSVADHPTLFPGFFKLCVTPATSRKGGIDYTMLMDSGPF